MLTSVSVERVMPILESRWTKGTMTRNNVITRSLYYTSKTRDQNLKDIEVAFGEGVSFGGSMLNAEDTSAVAKTVNSVITSGESAPEFEVTCAPRAADTDESVAPWYFELKLGNTITMRTGDYACRYGNYVNSSPICPAPACSPGDAECSVCKTL